MKLNNNEKLELILSVMDIKDKIIDKISFVKDDVIVVHHDKYDDKIKNVTTINGADFVK